MKNYAADIAEMRNDLKWIKEGITKMHQKQDQTNGRVLKLENESKNYVTKNEDSELKKKTIEVKGVVIVALISLFSSVITALIIHRWG